MRDMLERLLLATDVPDPERAQLRWEEYRDGADSADAARKSAADAAFAMLLAWYGNMIYRHIWGFVRSDGAEDVFQEVLKKLHENRRNPRLASFQANVLPWLRQVAIRQCVDAYRRAKRRKVRESRVARWEGAETPANPVELDEMLTAALARLSTDQQQAIALHYFEGLNRQEAAVTLEINRDTFAARLNAALARLRKLISAPAAIALGGTAGLPAALAVHPPALSAARLDKLSGSAWASASATTIAIPHFAAVVLLGLSLCGGAAATAWIMTKGRAPPPAPPSIAKGGAPVLPLESLRDRNLRVAREELVDPIRDLIQKLYPSDNRVRFESIRAFGPEVEVEFVLERRPPRVSGMPVRLRVRYCTFRRQLFVQGQDADVGRWYNVELDKPSSFSVSGPFGFRFEVVRGREELADVRRLLDSLLRDPQGETELLRFLFGPADGELLLPSGMMGVSGFAGGLILVSGGDGLFIRDTSGRWKYAGECRGWFPVVDGDRVFCYAESEIRVRPLADPAAPWRKWCDQPHRPGERGGIIFIAAGRLHMTIDPDCVASRPLSDPDVGWSRVASPVRHYGLAVAGGTLFGNDGKQLFARPVDDPSGWLPAGPWPDENYETLVADGDRLLALSPHPGPIYARPVKARPDVPWTVDGHVHDPYKR